MTIYEYILSFDVSMDDISLMEIEKSLRDDKQKLFSLVLR